MSEDARGMTGPFLMTLLSGGHRYLKEFSLFRGDPRQACEQQTFEILLAGEAQGLFAEGSNFDLVSL